MLGRPELLANAGAEEIALLVEELRPLLRRVIAVINGKGGQGKTPTTANLAGLAAEALTAAGSTRRVLAVDFDPQGNLGLNLGYRKKPGDDDGRGLVAALSGLGPLHVLRDVRPHLDVLPGGAALHDVPGLVFSRTGRGAAARNLVMLSLARVIAEIAADYEWILIDCPPLELLLQEFALIAARWALIPVTYDEGGRQGMEGVSARFETAGDLNPDLDVLGVVMFGFQYTDRTRPDGSVVEVGMRAEVRAELQSDLRRAGSDAPVFRSVIRSMPSVAREERRRGRLVHELEQIEGPKWWELRSGTATGRPVPNTEAGKVAQEYEDLAAEVFGRARELEG